MISDIINEVEKIINDGSENDREKAIVIVLSMLTKMKTPSKYVVDTGYKEISVGNSLSNTFSTMIQSIVDEDEHLMMLEYSSGCMEMLRDDDD